MTHMNDIVKSRPQRIILFVLFLFCGGMGAPKCSGRQAGTVEHLIEKEAAISWKILKDKRVWNALTRGARANLQHHITEKELVQAAKFSGMVSPKVGLLLSGNEHSDHDSLTTEAVMHARITLRQFLDENQNIDEFVKKVNEKHPILRLEKVGTLPDGSQLIRVVKEGIKGTSLLILFEELKSET